MEKHILQGKKMGTEVIWLRNPPCTLEDLEYLSGKV
jgi:hypothetical protein